MMQGNSILFRPLILMLLFALITLGSCESDSPSVCPCEPGDSTTCSLEQTHSCPIQTDDPPVPGTKCDTTSLKVIVDGAEHSPGTQVMSNATLDTLLIYSKVEQYKAYHVLLITLTDPASLPESVDLPNPLIRVDYELQTNKEQTPLTRVSVTTGTPATNKQIQATIKGNITFFPMGLKFGDTRCGTFSLELSWTENNTPHSAKLNGGFNTDIQPLWYR